MLIFIIISLIFMIIIAKIGLNIKIKEIKRVKEIGFNKSLNDITDKLPNNINVCKEMLNIIGNKNVEIEEIKDEKSKTSLYLVMQNKIIIADIKDTFTRIQTIAHECIHSIQNRKILKFNFIFSNIYTLYFIVITILTVFNIVNNDVCIMLLISYLLLGIIQFVVRNFLEIDAMIKAKYLAKEYFEKTKILNSDEQKMIIDKYNEINNIGIKLYSFMLLMQNSIKTVILTAIMLIFS